MNRINRMARTWMLTVLAAAGAVPACAATRAAAASVNAALPDAPQSVLFIPATQPFLLQFGGGPGSVSAASSSAPSMTTVAPVPALQTCSSSASTPLSGRMSCAPAQHALARYLKSPLVAPLTPRDKFILATKDIFDPFNLLTILGNAIYNVGSDAHGVYGPGVNGVAKDSGVNFTENMAGEYFGTFMVCSLTHQNPHYHREPYMPIRHRILHAIVQIAWTKSDTGRPMFNYANFVGGIATAVVSNTFVPGPGQQGWGNTSRNLALAFASSPSGNLVTEFLPDIASHINLHVVIFQRILNSVTNEEGGTVQ
jgi:hypothetical protein